MLVLRISLFEMSPTMEALLHMFILVVYTRLISGVTISDVGIDLVWSDDHGLDMRGHCSFTFSVGFCGAFKLELYPDKSLPLPKYEIFIDRDSLQKYNSGIKKYCDPPYFRLCSNNGMSTSGHESTPLVICNGSTWTPFWISWNEGRIFLGRGNIVGNDRLKKVSDPEFKHIDYVKMGADDTNTSANYMFERRTGRPDNPDMTCREKTTTTATTTTAAATSQTTTTTLTAGVDPTTVATSGTQVTISDVGIDLVWSDDHGLDMRGHCSFTFSVGFCGAFKLELYPDKSLPLPKYEIFIDRDSLQKYKSGIKKYCDPPYFRLCSNNGMGTSGHESTPLVICNGSTWTPFWISWNEGTISLGRGDIVGNDRLKRVSDPEFKHIDYVKMGADDTNTSANYMFEPRTGRPDNPDMTCREKATATATTTTAAATSQTTTTTLTAGVDPTTVATSGTQATTTTTTTRTRTSTTTAERGGLESAATARTSTTTAETGGLESAATATTSTTTAERGGLESAATATTSTTTAETGGLESAATATTSTTTAETGGLESAATTTTTTTTTTQPKETDDGMTVDNCDNARRPDSENLGMVFEKAAKDTTLSASNPDVEELDSATSGSCAELCASRQTCVLYSISTTGTCRITSACRPQVESETASVVLFLKYWG